MCGSAVAILAAAYPHNGKVTAVSVVQQLRWGAVAALEGAGEELKKRRASLMQARQSLE